MDWHADPGLIVSLQNGRVSLSTRTLLEMETYIREQHADHVTNCDLCKKLSLKVCAKKLFIYFY